jgi:hypothetical protein
VLLGSEDALIDRGWMEELLEGRRKDALDVSLCQGGLHAGGSVWMTTPIDENFQHSPAGLNTHQPPPSSGSRAPYLETKMDNRSICAFTHAFCFLFSTVSGTYAS